MSTTQIFKKIFNMHCISSINNKFKFLDDVPAKAVHGNKNNKCWLEQVVLESPNQLHQFTDNFGH